MTGEEGAVVGLRGGVVFGAGLGGQHVMVRESHGHPGSAQASIPCGLNGQGVRSRRIV